MTPRAGVICGLVVAAAGGGRAHAQVPADVRFMQHMIRHHAQALTMAALIRTHTANPALALLGQRITVSQRDEIGLMQHWLERHHAPVPSLDEGHAHEGMGGAEPLMPGMLSPAELAALGEARGPAFDQLFLTDMISHHEGALTMVGTLFAQKGAGQDSEVFGFATDVDADQRAEIARMRALLGPSTPRPEPKPQ